MTVLPCMCCHMFEKISLLRKCCKTYFILMIHLANVYCHMCDQFTSMRKCFITYFTFICVFSRQYVLSYKLLLLEKSFIKYFTYIIILASVYCHMRDRIISMRKCSISCHIYDFSHQYVLSYA
jgi:hypothetical protein